MSSHLFRFSLISFSNVLYKSYTLIKSIPPNLSTTQCEPSSISVTQPKSHHGRTSRGPGPWADGGRQRLDLKPSRLWAGLLRWLIRTRGKTPGPPGVGQGFGAGQTEPGPWALCVVGGVAVPAGQIQYTGTFWQGARSPHLPAGAWRRVPQTLLMEVEVAAPLDWNCEQDPEPSCQGVRSTCQQARARRSTPGLLDRRRCPGTRRAESGP